MNNTENPWMAAKNLNNPDSDDYSPKNEYTEGNFNLHNQLQKASVLTKILFLSKRGMSRSPLAREMMQKLISNSEFFGRIRVSSRGVTQAYDQCPIDARMSKFSSNMGYFLQGFSRFATIPDIASADLIITLDKPSDDFVTSYAQYTNAVVHPIGIFFSSGSEPYISDPFDREDYEDVDDHYDEIVSSLQFGCSKLFANLHTLIG